MKIEADGEEKIAVTLTNRDMQEFDITYEEMDYSNIETRRVIWTILDEAKRVLGKPISTDNRLLIQVSPLEEGGCLLHFTMLEECSTATRKRLIMKKDAEPLLFKAFDDDAFLDSIPIISKINEYTLKTEFFTKGDEYYIIITPKPRHSDKAILHLSEFGNISQVCKKDIAEIHESCLPLKIN